MKKLKLLLELIPYAIVLVLGVANIAHYFDKI